MKHGFSLVELSIVLVILGLLTGGILTGQSLIRAAELRSITTEFQRYQSAVNTFRDKYFALPGDMRNATDFWGTLANGGGCPSGSGVGTQTCNGSGNGRVDEGALANSSVENFMFWQHLANAGLIEGTYSGQSSTLGGIHTTTDNAPKAKLSTALWSTRYMGNFTNASWYNMNQDYGHIMQLGGVVTTGLGINEADILLPEEVWNIDTKLDDGVPGTGKTIVFDWTNCTEAANATDYSAPYTLTLQSQQCSIIFRDPY